MLSMAIDIVLALVGAVTGGALGYQLFVWIYQQGFYAMLLPGALLGLGCGALSRQPSWIRGVACAIAALGLELFTEWHFFPFVRDESLSFFLKHVHELPPIKLIMMALGVLFAFWWGKDGLLYSWLPRRPVKPQAPPGDLS
ncbi:MAG TPA: hypothetical protein VGZ22_10660 [Isosphaeraceae bacterium]|jgi:hypothetical protein|nr:hypothetical protein [Isosphaeraceae bacterium]